MVNVEIKGCIFSYRGVKYYWPHYEKHYQLERFNDVVCAFPVNKYKYFFWSNYIQYCAENGIYTDKFNNQSLTLTRIREDGVEDVHGLYRKDEYLRPLGGSDIRIPLMRIYNYECYRDISEKD